MPIPVGQRPRAPIRIRLHRVGRGRQRQRRNCRRKPCPRSSGPGAEGVATQLARQLADPRPADQRTIRQLGSYKRLDPRAHWDHVLWSSRLGNDVPRFATQDNVDVCRKELPELRRYIEELCPGHDLDLCGALTPLEAAGSLWPAAWEVAQHRAHAPGHALLWLEDRHVLIAGDMVSDIEIPILDLDQPDPPC